MNLWNERSSNMQKCTKHAHNAIGIHSTLYNSSNNTMIDGEFNHYQRYYQTFGTTVFSIPSAAILRSFHYHSTFFVTKLDSSNHILHCLLFRITQEWTSYSHKLSLLKWVQVKWRLTRWPLVHWTKWYHICDNILYMQLIEATFPSTVIFQQTSV